LRDVNLRLLELLGRSREQVVGHHISEFSQPTVDANEDTFHAVAQSRKGTVRDVRLVRPDGSVVLVDFSLSTITIGNEQLVLSIGRDITNQRRLEQQFMQAQKMEAVGRLAGGVAHDFNNILTAIVGHSELLKDAIPPNSPLQEGLGEVMKASERASALTRQLLAFSRQQILQPRVIDPNVVIGELEKMLHRLIGEDVAIRTQLSPAGRLMMDPSQLEQVLLNLAINARDAMNSGGTLTIETTTVTLPNDTPTLIGTTAPGEYVRLRVKDTGCGIDPEFKDRIFEPFFTTKPVGKGTGLGLSTVFNIVEQSHGAIGVTTALGVGTTFDVYFPVVTAAPTAAKPIATAAAPGGHETVLIAEDDPMLRGLATAVLERAGYRVLAAADSVDATAMADASADDISLLITDVIMPGGNGRDLAAHIIERRPNLKVLYTSGYTADIIGQHGVLDAGIAFLPKPFTPSQLRARVRQVLEAA
jgi:PAS domain S-box-containing protein